MTPLLTPIIVQLLHNFSNNLSYGLYRLDVLFRLLKLLLQILEGKAHWKKGITKPSTMSIASLTILQLLTVVLMLPHFLYEPVNLGDNEARKVPTSLYAFNASFRR